MHDHPSGVVTFLTEAHVKFTLPDGKSQEKRWKVGEPGLAAAGKHLPENLSDKPSEAILVELKAKPAKTEPTKTKRGENSRANFED